MGKTGQEIAACMYDVEQQKNLPTIPTDHVKKDKTGWMNEVPNPWWVYIPT